jgi:hypothetical protein
MVDSRWLIAGVVGLLGCSGAEAASTSSQVAGAPHAIHMDVALAAANGNVTLPTQNGSMVDVPVKDLVGKQYFWGITPEGASLGNVDPLEVGLGTMPEDLTLTLETKASYLNGGYEVAMFVLVVPGDPKNGPVATDLAAFSLDPALPGEPALTGVSVRVRVKDADATLTLDNNNFIRLAK